MEVLEESLPQFPECHHDRWRPMNALMVSEKLTVLAVLVKMGTAQGTVSSVLDVVMWIFTNRMLVDWAILDFVILFSA